MKHFHFFPVLIFSLLITFPAFAEGDSDASLDTEKTSPWNFSLTTDGAYYFKSDAVAGGTHFAPVTGFYDGIEARTTFDASYIIPTPLGTNFLVENANVKITASFELSPLTVKPGLGVSFEPVPFLVFSAGGWAGTGWPLIGMQGLGVMNEKNEFDNLATFKNWYLEGWAKGLFQFDTGAIFPGDWTHVLMQASITFSYVCVTGIENGDLWLWQTGINNCSGWRYAANFVLGYQLPFALDMVGVMTDIMGQMNPDDYGRYNKNYNGGFAEIDFSPVVRINFGKKDTLFVLGRIKSRRSFNQGYSTKYEMINLDYAGREWLFDRIALSWTHTF